MRRSSESSLRAAVEPRSRTTGAESERTPADEQLIERLQRGAFGYFERFTNPDNGLVADDSRQDSPSSIAVVGFALSCYPVAVQRGWMTRRSAVARTMATLRFLAESKHDGEVDATGHRGFYYHFLDMATGRRVWDCELSLIDSALLLAGILTVGRFFDGAGEEPGIRALAEALYERVDWRWAQNDSPTLAQGWKPECGFLHYGWEGYNEALLLYVLGLGSPTHPLSDSSYATWTKTYQWEHLLGQDVLYSGSLFTHLFSHAWIDLRGVRDPFMREKDSDYFENTRRSIEVQREYCELNPRRFEGYGRDLWGISAGDGPVDDPADRHPRDTRHLGYMARGVPFGPDDGTLCPWAMLATLPFCREVALAGTRRILERYPEVCVDDRFISGFNPALVSNGSRWLSDGWYGLDQGLIVLMLENARSGLPWSLFGDIAPVRTGLVRAGFSGGWLGT